MSSSEVNTFSNQRADGANMHTNNYRFIESLAVLGPIAHARSLNRWFSLTAGLYADGLAKIRCTRANCAPIVSKPIVNSNRLISAYCLTQGHQLIHKFVLGA